MIFSLDNERAVPKRITVLLEGSWSILST